MGASSVLLLSHNGMGDNLYMTGLVRYLLTHYQHVHFLCKQRHASNIEMFYSDTDRVKLVPFPARDERAECLSLRNLWGKRIGGDVIICGSAHKGYLKSRVTNQGMLRNRPGDNGYDLNCDMINDNNYSFVRGFYRDAGVGLSVFYDYWMVPEYPQSRELYELVKNYRIVFLQTTSSDGRKLRIQGLKERYLKDEGTILLSNDENLYEGVDEKKAAICQRFVRNKMVYYIDTIKNSSEVYIIDSCFIGIVLPLYKKGLLKAEKVRIVLREAAHTVVL